MVTLRGAYLSVYEPTMVRNGFSQKGVIFHKLVNGKIIQLLTYKQCHYGASFTLEFGLWPLCEGGEFTTFIDAHRLGSLIGNEAIEWECNDNNQLDIMKQTLEICKEHLFPCFERMTGYESYITGMFDMYEKMYKGYGYGIFLKSNLLYAASLATGDYSLAQKSREALIEQNELAMKQNEAMKSVDPPSPWPGIIRKHKEEYVLMKTAMDTNDRAYIDAFIKRNEQRSLESYMRNFKVKF